MKKMTYKTSGVDIQKANIFIDSIADMTKSTMNASVIRRKGSFGSLFSFDTKKYKKPVLVASTDGVGTKLMIGNVANKHDTIGIDLVAMNVNDVLCTGAKPLFFLDYIACGKLDPNVLTKVIKGIAEGCRQSGCGLVGGETAEMPGIYKQDDYDLAGFAVGVVEKSKIIDGSKIKKDNVVIGIASSGLHSNGFSLVRKVFTIPEQRSLSQELLRPTKIYVKPILKLIEKHRINGIAHITGGAFYEKLTKILPKGKCFEIQKGSWPMPKIFEIIQKRAKISDKEMFTTFNMGIGLVLVVERKDAASVLCDLKKSKLECWQIGRVINHNQKRIIL
ncbi:MAG: phosphoribosylformylglycinamidine cyclo-ligase [Candidatus Omnitrophica bacterium]|nr:phosphoribosylformylglycinamidine cyclo-ligase [Candidatus Omnitrophota bacterium]